MVRMVIILSILAGVVTQDEKKEPTPELKVPQASKPIKVDGILDDEAWKEAATSTAFKLPHADHPEGKTKLFVTQDENHLYVAVECTEEEELIANIDEHDGDGIWMDDDVELFLDPTNERKAYYQIIVNSTGITWDAYHSQPRENDITWEPKYPFKAKVTKTGWVAEFALPWGIFERTEKLGADWAFNVLRMRQAAHETIYWSPVYAETSHTPERFGTLKSLTPKKKK